MQPYLDAVTFIWISKSIYRIENNMGFVFHLTDLVQLICEIEIFCLPQEMILRSGCHSILSQNQTRTDLGFWDYDQGQTAQTKKCKNWDWWPSKILKKCWVYIKTAVLHQKYTLWKTVVGEILEPALCRVSTDRGRGRSVMFALRTLKGFWTPDNWSRFRCTFLCNCRFCENSQTLQYSFSERSAARQAELLGASSALNPPPARNVYRAWPQCIYLNVLSLTFGYWMILWFP